MSFWVTVRRMKNEREDLRKPYAEVDDARKSKTPPKFISITRAFFASTASKELQCPRCGASLNFAHGTEWVGPDSFTCSSCAQLINIKLIHQALQDLGVK
jgi:transposase-like protein